MPGLILLIIVYFELLSQVLDHMFLLNGEFGCVPALHRILLFTSRSNDNFSILGWLVVLATNLFSSYGELRVEKRQINLLFLGFE